MNAHEIITLVCLVAPIAYVIGRFDEHRNPADNTIQLTAVIFVAAVVSTAVAITLRIVG